MKNSLLFSIVFLITGFSLTAQTNPGQGLIEGRIVNAADNKPFPEVNITLFSLPDSAKLRGIISGADGTFRLGNLVPGKYGVEAHFVGFTTAVRTVNLTADNLNIKLGDIRLDENRISLSGVDVVQAKPGIILQGDKKILNVDQLKKTGATTLAQVLENAPGITTDPEGNVLLRGSSQYQLLIDGKPSPAAGPNILKQLPPDMVETIEIITNPSAKYEAEGAAGIINLILKKQKTGGFNAQATLMAGWNNKYSGDLQGNYRKNKINVFAGFSGNYIETNAKGYLNRTLKENLISTNRFSDLVQTIAVNSLNLNAGIDYDINPKNSVTLSGRAGNMINNVLVENRITVGLADSPISSWSLYNNKLNLAGYYYNPQINYRHKFDDKGHNLDFDVFTGGFIGTLNQLTNEFPSNTNWTVGEKWITKNNSVTDLSILDTRIKSDYTKPFENGNKIEAGAQLSIFNDRSDFLYQDYDTLLNDWTRNDKFSNDYSLTRNIYAGYGVWSGKIKKITYSAGLRAEYEDRVIRQTTLSSEFHSQLLSLFPSGSASIELKDKQQLAFSFSRRINRPNGMSLNPFPQFIDNQTIRTGNPDLKPEFTQSFELGYQKQVKLGSFSAQGYYRRMKDLETFVLIPDSLNRIVMMPMNADRSHSTGIELTANLQATKWLRLMGSGNVYYYILQDPSMSAELKNKSLAWTAKLNTVFLFGPTTYLAVTANYTGPTIMLQGRMGGNFLMNIGFTQSLMKRKASLTLGVRDLLRTGRSKFETFTGNLTTTTNILMESPMVTLTFTYNLNNYQRRTEEEQLELNFIR